SEVPPSALPYAFFSAAVLSWRQGDYERAATLSQKGLALGRHLEEREGIARGLLGLGLVEMGRDDRRADAWLEEALTLFRELGDNWWIAFVLAQLASTTRRQGDCERAKAFAEESLALFKDTGDPWAIAYTRRSLGHVAVAQDDYGRAAMFYT